MKKNTMDVWLWMFDMNVKCKYPLLFVYIDSLGNRGALLHHSFGVARPRLPLDSHDIFSCLASVGMTVRVWKPKGFDEFPNQGCISSTYTKHQLVLHELWSSFINSKIQLIIFPLPGIWDLSSAWKIWLWFYIFLYKKQLLSPSLFT